MHLPFALEPLQGFLYSTCPKVVFPSPPPLLFGFGGILGPISTLSSRHKHILYTKSLLLLLMKEM